MGLFNSAQLAQINKVAEQSKQLAAVTPSNSHKGMTDELDRISKKVKEYFVDSEAILITTVDELHSYIDDVISCGEAGIDTETTGLDRIKDHIVGASLYYPGGVECYIPIKHLVPLFDDLRRNQLTYEQVQVEFQRLVDAKVKLVFANADFDLSMIYKDINVDMVDVCYYDVILAWRCLKENERDNSLKALYNKYVLKGKGDPMKFSDFFKPTLFPYCKPEVAKLYAAHDARITYELYKWQLPYVTKTHPKCQKAQLEAIADLVREVEFPLIKVCQLMHRRGVYLDKDTSTMLIHRYRDKLNEETIKLSDMVQSIMDQNDKYTIAKSPFNRGSDFNPNSSPHVQFLCKTLLKLDVGKSVDKHVLADLNLPVTNQIVAVRNAVKLLSTYVEKLPNSTGPDGKIHAKFNSIGASTGRFSSSDPNMQNIPSHAGDIRHMFRATPSQIDTVSCTFDDLGTGVAEVADWSELNINGEYVSVLKLCLGDVIILESGTQHISGELLDIYPSDTPGHHMLKFSVDAVDDMRAVDWKLRIRYQPYIMLSSDYSAQEPRITAYVSNDPNMIKAFKENKDIYASVASVAFKVPYEQCLEFHPETHEYQPEGKRRRSEAKTIVLGTCYGRSVPSIGEQLYGSRTDMSEEDKTREAQKVYDAVLNAFPNLRKAMLDAQNMARQKGYVTTILGRRRHIPEMQLPEFEFKPLAGYVNPDVDPLDPASLVKNTSAIPERIVNALMQEFKGYKYFGQIAKRTKELYENDKIRVINNRPKINDGSRQCLNSVIQGSAAEMTKLAMLMLENDAEWKAIGGRLILPVHDELIAEVPEMYADKGGEVLSRCMCDAASFLPFPSKCDVTTTYRWYGMEYPCPYPEPVSLADTSEGAIKWIQYHLCEMEYVLPVFPEPDGSKPRGDAASGVNGKMTPECEAAMIDYLHRYNVSKDQFIQHIKQKVQGEI